jgi:hypothetical protein
MEITEKWILERVSAGVCEVTGLPFILPVIKNGKQKNQPFSPSLDRKNPALGYTPDNCRVVVWAFNAALADWGEEIYLAVARAYLRAKDLV